MKKLLYIPLAAVLILGVVLLTQPHTAFAAASVRSSQFFTSNSNQTVATIVTGDCVVFVGEVSDGDHTHSGIDSPFQIGGVNMTSITQSLVSGQNNQVDIAYLANVTGGTSVTFAMHYHAGSPGFQGALYVIQNCTSVQPTTSGHLESTGAANPSIALTGVNAGDLILEGLASSATPTAASGQTIDVTSTGNGSTFNIAEKTATAGTNTESWTMASNAFAFNAIAITGVSTGAPVQSGTQMMMGSSF